MTLQTVPFSPLSGPLRDHNAIKVSLTSSFGELERPFGVPDELYTKRKGEKHHIRRMHSMLSLKATERAEKLYPDDEKAREAER